MILENNRILKKGSWLSGDEIQISLDHFPVGYHRIVLTARDWFGNSNSDAVDVNILHPLKSESSIVLNAILFKLSRSKRLKKNKQKLILM